jgi:1-acyl-sn-glycerol-3-phosphate acyltransferase
LDNQKCNEHKTNLKSNFNFKIDDNYNFYDKSFIFKFWNFLHRLTAFCFLKPYIFIKHCVKVKGKENIKEIKNKGAVVISNHIDVLDIQMIALFLFGMRKYNWLTLERNFCLSVHWLLKNSGAIPVPTDSKYKSKFFQQINDLLKNKELLHICPEAAL